MTAPLPLPSHVRAELVGRSDADLFHPGEDHEPSSSTVAVALRSAGVLVTDRTIGAYLRGWRAHRAFLAAAVAVGVRL